MNTPYAPEAILTYALYRKKLQFTEQAVEEYRAQVDNRKAENYGFASMAAVPYAHIVANMLRRKRVKGTTITLAPNPKDIVRQYFISARRGAHVRSDLGQLESDAWRD